MIKALTDVTLKKRIREGIFFVLITYSYIQCNSSLKIRQA